MSVVRAIARPLLAAQFIRGGIQSFRDPGPRTGPAAKFATLAHKVAPQFPSDPHVLVRTNAAIHVVGGLLLATNKFPRIAAAALAGSLVPTTIFGHPFWSESDPAKRSQQTLQFTKNLSMLGGLLLATVDTEGQPGLAWRARHAVDHAGATRERVAHDVSQRAQLLSARAKLRARDVVR